MGAGLRSGTDPMGPVSLLTTRQESMFSLDTDHALPSALA